MNKFYHKNRHVIYLFYMLHFGSIKHIFTPNVAVTLKSINNEEITYTTTTQETPTTHSRSY